jgi:hypothetical protein
MERLTPELRQRARELFVAHFDEHPPPSQAADEWQAERTRILSGKWDVAHAADRHGTTAER